MRSPTWNCALVQWGESCRFDCVHSSVSWFLPPTPEGWGEGDIFSLSVNTTPVPGSFPGLPQSQVLRSFLRGGGVTPVLARGVTLSWLGGTPGQRYPIQDRSIPLSSTGANPRTGYAAGGMPCAVSPRRTFLLYLFPIKFRIQRQITISKLFTGTTTRVDIESCSASSEHSSSYVCNNVYDDNTYSYWATRSEGIGSWIQVGLFDHLTALCGFQKWAGLGLGRSSSVYIVLGRCAYSYVPW